MRQLPVKALYCSFSVIPEATGVGNRAANFISWLAPLLDLQCITIKPPGQASNQFEAEFAGAKMMRVSIGEGALPAQSYAFERALRRHLETEAENYQVAHFTDPFGGQPLCELRSRYGFKLLYDLTSFPSVELRYTHPALEGDERFFAKLRQKELFCLMNSDAILVGSQQTASMVQSLGAPSDKIVVLPAHVDLEQFPPDKLGKPDRAEPRALYLGNSRSWQGLPTLFAALANACKLVPIKLVLVAPQSAGSRADLEKIIAENGVASNVELASFSSSKELVDLLSSADICVASLDNSERNTVQGAPIGKIACYLAAGRPVLASDLPIVREITDKTCALYYFPDDVNDLADKLVELARDPVLRMVMGERGRVLARVRLSSDLAKKRLLGCYSSKLGVVGEGFPEPVLEPAALISLSVARSVIATPTRAQTEARGAAATSQSSARIGESPDLSQGIASKGGAGAESAIVENRDGTPKSGGEGYVSREAAFSNEREVAQQEIEHGARSNTVAEGALDVSSGQETEASDIEEVTDIEEIEEVEEAVASEPSEEAAKPGPRTPSSGLPASEEWLGHVLFGYSPFRVRFTC